jgi:hypothetical protein
VRWLLLLLATVGCSRTPRIPDGGVTADLLYLIHNQLWRGATRLGTVGDDPQRTGFPRALGDGRIALLADDTGAIYPYVGPSLGDGRSFRSVGDNNVTLHDALCAVATSLVFTVTPFDGSSARLMRADAGGIVTAVAVEGEGRVVEPAAWDDSAVLAVRSARGAVTVEILDVAGGRTRELLATIDPPYGAHAPARLPDGRVVFVRTDPRDSTDTAVGELFVLERGGVARSTGITGVRALVVVGSDVVYEVGGADGITDLVRTDLVGAPVNLTRTPYVSEHLGWSD